MNSKMLLAFVGGLIVASGVTYIAMRRNSPPPMEPAAQVQAPPQSPAQALPVSPPTADTPADPATTEPPEAKPAPAKTKATRAKPSPWARAHSNERVVQSAPDPVAAAPAPATPPPASEQAPQPAQPQEVAKVEPPSPPPYVPPPPPQPHTVTIPLGTNLVVRLSERLTTERNQPGDQFSAVLDQPLTADGFVIAERGARVQGRIVELERSGKVRGLARMSVELTHLKTSDGQNVRINTSAYTKQAESTRTRDAEKVGIGAAIGAAIGAIAGGGKGAGIGAGVGGAAGAGDVAMTRGKPAELPVESRLTFRLSEALKLTEKLH
jgi:hypothetical protein